VPSHRRASRAADEGGADLRTVLRDLEALRDWLREAGVTHVGSTGVYWRPVYAVLEGHFELIVGNARHIRNVPGAQDRREGFRMDRRSGAARPDRQKLPAAPAVAGSARFAALSPQACGEPSGRTQPAPEAPGDRQHQAGERPKPTPRLGIQVNKMGPRPVEWVG
jgi:hypothetical protein